MASRLEIISEIRSAFHGVVLDGGISLDQTKVIDDYGRRHAESEFSSLPLGEITDDWTKIPASVLDEASCLSHLDRKGFRYYIPALMLRVLDAYDSGSMMTIGTLSILYPKSESWIYLYSLLSQQQNRAIANYLQALPILVNLEGESVPVVERAFRNYWSKQLD